MSPLLGGSAFPPMDGEKGEETRMDIRSVYGLSHRLAPHQPRDHHHLSCKTILTWMHLSFMPS